MKERDEQSKVCKCGSRREAVWFELGLDRGRKFCCGDCVQRTLASRPWVWNPNAPATVEEAFGKADCR